MADIYEDFLELKDDRDRLRRAIARMLHDPTGSAPPGEAMAALSASLGVERTDYAALMKACAYPADCPEGS